MNWVEWIGWSGSLMLMATVGSQVWKQIRQKNCEGVSRFLFIGQLITSALFLAYAWMLDNPVFVFSNAFLILAALVGHVAMLRNRRRQSNSVK